MGLVLGENSIFHSRARRLKRRTRTQTLDGRRKWAQRRAHLSVKRPAGERRGGNFHPKPRTSRPLGRRLCRCGPHYRAGKLGLVSSTQLSSAQLSARQCPAAAKATPASRGRPPMVNREGPFLISARGGVAPLLVHRKMGALEATGGPSDSPTVFQRHWPALVCPLCPLLGNGSRPWAESGLLC